MIFFTDKFLVLFVDFMSSLLSYLHQTLDIFSSPLPPLPIGEKQRPATLENVGSRMSHADSDGLPEDERFYSRVDGAPPPIPQREVRPRSVGYGSTPPRPTHQRTLSKPLSPKLPLRHSLPTPTDGVDQSGLRSSWSEPGPEPAPPLPPRGCSEWIFLDKGNDYIFRRRRRR